MDSYFLREKVSAQMWVKPINGSHGIQENPKQLKIQIKNGSDTEAGSDHLTNQDSKGESRLWPVSWFRFPTEKWIFFLLVQERGLVYKWSQMCTD